MRPSHLALASLLTLTVAGSALALVKYHLGAGKFETQISGKNTKVWSVGVVSRHHVAFGIDMWEDSDEPCEIRVRSRHINNFSTDTKVGNSNPFQCRRNENSKKSIQFGGTREYIRGIAVCLNSGEDRVKGVKIYGVKLDAEKGTLTTISTPKKFERTNCKHWKPPVYCPPGKVAQQIRVSYRNAGGGKKGIRGLGLVCRLVEKD